MERKNYIVAVDLGSSTVAVAVGEKNAEGLVEVLSLVSKPVEGVHAGRIENIELVSRSIREAVSETEEQLGIRITEAYAGISGDFVRCARHTDHVFVYDPQNGVSQHDVDALFDRMRNVQAPDDESIMERVPQNYMVDDNQEVRNPVGSFGKKLSSTFNFILCLKTPIQRLDMALKRLGIGRISINPQTMNDETLRLIGRDHTARQTCEAFALARELGFDDINMDVIAGLPGEDEAAFARTMEAVRRLAPDSLTVHTLAIKRSSRLNLERAPLPDAAVAAAMVRLGEETAEALGLVPYYLYRQKYMAGQQQNVGYARPGAACLYNVDIMEETTSIVAMGAGAISKRVLPDRELRIRRAPNVTNVSVYIDRVREMTRRKEELFMQTEGENPCES